MTIQHGGYCLQGRYPIAVYLCNLPRAIEARTTLLGTRVVGAEPSPGSDALCHDRPLPP